jgi:hypothetical protein
MIWIISCHTWYCRKRGRMAEGSAYAIDIDPLLVHKVKRLIWCSGVKLRRELSSTAPSILKLILWQHRVGYHRTSGNKSPLVPGPSCNAVLLLRTPNTSYSMQSGMHDPRSIIFALQKWTTTTTANFLPRGCHPPPPPVPSIPYRPFLYIMSVCRTSQASSEPGSDQSKIRAARRTANR